MNALEAIKYAIEVVKSQPTDQNNAAKIESTVDYLRAFEQMLEAIGFDN